MIGSIDHFVDQQILLWQEERRIRERKGVEGNVQRPTICISRQYGARGAAMGRMVADRLGFRFYSDELIHDIAEAAHVRQQVVETLDERVQDGIAEWVAGLIKRGVFAPSDYLRNLSNVVLTLGRHGKGVIVGRGAHFLLDGNTTLRVRVIAPQEVRVARIAARDELSETDARAKVLRIDEERVAFNRQHYNADIRDPNNYDLVVNAGTMGVEGAAAQTIAAFQHRFGAA
ncbi:MAG TPA: cytidylate kinase-like family protein [Polyangia bacterium]|jgi:cytidylate kinase|nr:cytidylate kinase-like family protein [Polyangia bacterium]